MVIISDTAGSEISKVLQTDQAKGKALFVNFLGYGWSGPVLGLALDEPDETYSHFTSNNIDVLMHPDLAEQLRQFGGVVIDFIDNGPYQRGFTISTKTRPSGADCSGCSSASDHCGDESPEH